MSSHSHVAMATSQHQYIEFVALLLNKVQRYSIPFSGIHNLSKEQKLSRPEFTEDTLQATT